MSYLLIFAAMLTFAPAFAVAQAGLGVVVDENGRPISVVVVLLIDTRAGEASRALTDDRGEYRLRAPRAGVYRIRTLRIGFRPFVAGPFALAAGEQVDRRLVIAGVAFALDTVRAVGRNVCRVVAADSTSTISAVWEQVRGALIAAQLTVDTRAILATTLGYQRTMDARSRRIAEQSVDVRSDFVRQPWKSMTADSLRKTGYVFTVDGDIRIYNAPGLEVLLSDEFVADHCFRIAEGSTDKQLGIEFEPTSDRRKFAEIRGTLWLDRVSSELREMAYRYINVSRDEERTAGGTIGFSRLRNGMWAISRWEIRMPMMVLVPRFDSRLKAVGHESRIDSIKITGGELVLAVLASARGRDTVWMRPWVELRGTVLDSLSADPVPGAIVTLGGTTQMDTTDSDGRFLLPGVLPGRYALDIRTPSLDSVNTVDQRTIVFTDSSVSLAIRVPTATQVAGSICGGTPGATSSGPGIVIGGVSLGGATAPAANVRVSASWTEVVVEAGRTNQRTRTAQTRTDTLGRYRLCGLPVNTALTLASATDSAEAGPKAVRIPQTQRFTTADFTMEPRTATTSSFVGVVVADSTQVPIADADVRLSDIGLSTRTDARGAFRIFGIIPGTHDVIVRRVGYGAMEAMLDFGAGAATDRRIVLSRVTVLDSLLSTSNRNMDPNMADFAENRRMGLGHFVTREGAMLSSFLMQTPGLRVMTGPGGEWAVGSRPMRCLEQPPKWGPGSICEIYYVPSPHEREMGVPVACFSRVYLDNQLMNARHAHDAVQPAGCSSDAGRGDGVLREFGAGPGKIHFSEFDVRPSVDSYAAISLTAPFHQPRGCPIAKRRPFHRGA